MHTLGCFFFTFFFFLSPQNQTLWKFGLSCISLEREREKKKLIMSAFSSQRFFLSKPATFFFFLYRLSQPRQPSVPASIRRRRATLRRKGPLSGTAVARAPSQAPAGTLATKAKAARGNKMVNVRTSLRRRKRLVASQSKPGQAARPRPGRSSSPGRRS